jgi:hypothetical protein
MVLSSGRFATTSRQDLAAAFDAFAGSPQKDRLIIHFHGGVVSESRAEAIADRLLPVYQQAGGYPFFVIWQSGLVETLRNNWREIIHEEVFGVLVDRVLQFVIGKLDQAEGEKGREVECPTRGEIQAEVAAKQELNQTPFAHREDETTKLDEELTAAEQAQFDQLLGRDPALTNAARKLMRPDAPRLGPEIQADLEHARGEGETGEKALIGTALLVRAGVRILARSIKRLATGRDHGIYTTVIEEVTRELKGDLLGGVVWKHMKKDTADSFDGPADTHGGTALLEEIARSQVAGGRPRIVLVGHSTGAVYICHLLQKAAAVLPPEIRFEVVFLAPACSFALLDGALSTAAERIVGFRSFGMQDALEKADALFSPLYVRSLLYFVSGLVEDSVDLPLVGMQRYHSGKSPFDVGACPEIQRVRDRLAAFPSPWIWSESTLGEGLNCLAHTHGDFDNDQSTLASIASLIRQEVP